MTTMPRFSLLILILALAALGGCASSGPNRFDGVNLDGQRGRQVRYVLESEAGNEGSLTLEARGEPMADVDGRTSDTIRFTLTADNASDDPVVLFPAEMTAVDDQGRNLRQVATFLPPGSPAGIFRVDPQQRTSMEIVFDTGAPETLDTTGSIALSWKYEYRGTEREHVTRFLPTRVTRVYRDTYYGVGSSYNPWWPYGFWGGGFYGRYW